MQRLLLICAALLALTACKPQSPEAAELEAFAAAFKQANQAADIQPMLTLYELEGSTEQTVNLLKNALHYELAMPIQSIEFEPLSGSPEETIQYEHQGIRYGATLVPRLRMRVRYDTEDAFESLFTIGQNDAGDWRIACSQPIEAAP